MNNLKTKHPIMFTCVESVDLLSIMTGPWSEEGPWVAAKSPELIRVPDWVKEEVAGLSVELWSSFSGL